MVNIRSDLKPTSMIFDSASILNAIHFVIRKSYLTDFVPIYKLMPGELVINVTDDILFIGMEDGSCAEMKIADIPEPLQSVIRAGKFSMQLQENGLHLPMGPRELAHRPNPCGEIIASEPFPGLNVSTIHNKKEE